MKMSECVFTIVAIAIILLTLSPVQKTENFVSVVPAQPSKCFDCEHQLPDRLKYLSGPSKCFSCEKELLARNPPGLPGLGQPTKCFSCERQMLR
tara:strand:+ start:763 stop:1044 length:282 start_codon:yes stop_codon:yes gene_type:complete